MRSDLVVVGAGAAGLFAALTAAREGARVTLVSARPLAETASYWAQGGARRGARGRRLARRCTSRTRWPPAAGSCAARAAEVLCEEAPARVARPRGARRALRRRPPRRPRARARGRPQRAAASSTRAAARPAGGSCASCRPTSSSTTRIEVLEGRRAARARSTDDGAASACLDDGARRSTRRARRSSPRAAPPRCGRAPPTRPARSAPACCSPARPAPTLADLEFAQFHPTAVVGLPGREGFLISEAVRGEGATLHDAGRRALRRRARAARRGRARDLQRLLRRTGATSVGLDMTLRRPRRASRTSSPRCARPGWTRRRERVPVAPASHYVMGGIVTDLDGRATASPGLYAVGECACTGLHGANRLASNSLSGVLRVRPPRGARRRSTSPRPRRTPGAATPTPVAAAPTRETREAMWRHAGLERNAEGLGRCSTTRTRSPAWSPPARSRARRAAAPTRAPSSPDRSRRSTAGTRSSTPDAPPRIDAGADRQGPANVRVRLNAKSTKTTFGLHEIGKHSCARATEPARRRSGVRGGPVDVPASAAPSTGSSSARSSRTASAGRVRPTTSACCARARRPSTAWRPTGTTSPGRRKTLFNDIRIYFPMSAQLRVYCVVDRYLTLRRRVPRDAARQRLRPRRATGWSAARRRAGARRASACRCRTTATARRTSTWPRPKSVAARGLSRER